MIHHSFVLVVQSPMLAMKCTDRLMLVLEHWLILGHEGCKKKGICKSLDGGNTRSGTGFFWHFTESIVKKDYYEKIISFIFFGVWDRKLVLQHEKTSHIFLRHVAYLKRPFSLNCWQSLHGHSSKCGLSRFFHSWYLLKAVLFDFK